MTKLASLAGAALLLVAACGPAHGDADIEARRIAAAMRAALVEVVRHDPAMAPRNAADLCRKLRYMRDGYRTPHLIELAAALPGAWFDNPQAVPGRHGGYRFVVTGGMSGIVAVPDPPGPQAHTTFYARLPAGMFQRPAEGLAMRDGDPAPDIGPRSAWRPVQAIK